MVADEASEFKLITYGKKSLNYTLIRCKRKSLEIAVHPDLSIVVKAPFGADITMIEKKILKRGRWILRQLNYFRKFIPRTPDRHYISGETHLYMGKQYRLKIIQGKTNSVKLIKGFFLLSCNVKPSPEMVKKILEKWYREKANVQFLSSLDRCWSLFPNSGHTKPELSIKIMKRRWGSLSASGTITLNLELIKAPKDCIDYVVTHELCHLLHDNHNLEFYSLLASMIPRWEMIKHKLELSLV